MLEIVMIVAGVVLMARIADMEKRSPVVWGAVTLGLCLASQFVSWPLFRIFLAVLASFLLMFALKMARK